MQQSRISSLKHWLSHHFSVDSIELISMTGDAGFRCYYRFFINNQSFIAVDAPNDKSNNIAFIHIQACLAKQGILVPEIIAIDREQGFFCLSDFGNVLFADVVTEENMIEQYQRVIHLLPVIATCQQSNVYPLPVYDKKFIEVELTIFIEWLLNVHLKLSLTDEEQQSLTSCFNILIESALEQPQVMIHRDYHSRNIMITKDNQIGIIDFQDAVLGPITYDIVSLLRDCYLRWPQQNVEQLFQYFCHLIVKKIPEYNAISANQWQRWFDLMGLQRHIKASGIFARLHHRDGKNAYLPDIPLTLSYISDISKKYPELTFLNELIVNKVNPALKNT